ncbi:MAG: 16S rRNA (guanine(527)-N(7))-methyltransferase RsmG [Vulcanimicrobiaceae bacterium]
MSGDQTELAAHLAAVGVDVRLVEPISRFGALLLAENRTTNLTGAKTAIELAPHLLDALTVVPYLHGHYVDIGSGGGLPAIPAAIASGCEVTLVESIQKKARFLERMLGEFQLAGRVVPLRAEVAARDEALRDRFDVGTARAVALAPTVAELLLPLLAPSGIAVLQRGAMEERERNAVRDAALMLGAEAGDEIVLDGERRLVFLHKRAPTPMRFPRREGIPAKRPLCY